MSMFISGSSTSTGSFGKIDFAGTGNRTLIKYTHQSNANLNIGVTTNEAGSGGQFVIAGGSALTNRIATFQHAGGQPRLGIGVTNPINSSLAISAPADNDIQLDVSTGGNGYYGLGMASGGQHRYLLGNTYSTTTTRFSITAGGLTTAHDRITIYNALGNGREHYVGINKGATNPAHSLDVSGSIVFANGTQAVQISGSAQSTGSFGRVEGTKLAAGDNNITTNSLRIQTTSRFFGVSGNSINMTANGSAITSGAYNIVVGRLNIGHTYSTIDFGRLNSSSTLQNFRVQHHVSEAGKNPWGILNPQYTTLSMFDNSGSLFLNYGDVSGSSTSTSSFGRLEIPMNAGSVNLYGTAELRLGPEPYHATLNYNNNGNLDIAARSSYNIDITHGDLLVTEGDIQVPDNNEYRWGTSGTRMLGQSGYIQFQLGSTDKMRIDSSGNVLFQAANAKISGSSTSTGSFGSLVVAGRVQGDTTFNDDIIFPNGTDSKISFPGGGTHEIFREGYYIKYQANLGHSFISSGNETFSGGQGTVYIRRSSTNHSIETTMSDFKYIAGSGTGGFGFRTVGSDYEYLAIKSFKTGADQGLIFQTRTHSTSTHTERMRIHTDGTIGFVGANLLISGSATSTGSFGSVFVGNINNDKSLSIGDNTRGNHKIYDHQSYLRFDSSIWLGNGYIYVGGTLNLDAGANDIRLGSSSGGANTIHFKTDGSTDGISIVQNHLSGSLASTASFGRLRLTSNTTGSDVFTVNGKNGRLFTITDEMSGSIFSANLISGLPVIEAFSDNKVNIGPFSSPIQIDSLGNISGSASSTGSFGAGYIDNKLGIGTTSPVSTLHVEGVSTTTSGDANAGITLKAGGQKILQGWDEGNVNIGDGTFTTAYKIMLHGTTKVQNAHFVVDQNKKLAWGNQTVYLAGSEANGIDFYHSSTHLGRWKTTGLGIGTTDIGYPLDVHGNMMLSGALYGFQDGSGRVYDRKFLEFAPQPCYYTGDNNHFHTFKSYGGTAIMSIGGANNRVGIGETSPDELLHIKSSTASKPVIKLENAGDVTNGAQLHFVMSTTSEGDNDIPGTIRFKGMNSANAETEFSTIYTKNIDITDGTEDSEMHFRTMAAGTLGSTMMIQSDKVGIGTTSPSQIFHVVDSSNGTTPDLLSVRSTGSEVRIGIGVSNPSTALDFSTALPNGGGTIQGVFRMNLINNIRVGSHNGRLVLQSNNGIRIGAYNDNPSGNVYGLEVKHTRASTNTGDNILNVLNSDNTSLMMVKSSGAMGLGTDSPDTKLDIEGNSSNGTIVQIRDTGDDYPTGITYNHGVSGHHYAWYAGTMDGTSGERKFTIGTKVVNGFHNDLTTSDYSLLTLYQDGGSVSVTNDLDVGGNLKVGNTSNTHDNWISFRAQDGAETDGSGITWYETGTFSVSSPQYGAKIVYDEDSDDFHLGTMNNNTFFKQITIPRGTRAVEIFGHCQPQTDNTYDLGNSSFRWDDVRATNGTIQTSDRNLKTQISGSDLGLDFINDLNPVKYQWLSKSRSHYGLIAQEVSSSLAKSSVHTDNFGGYVENRMFVSASVSGSEKDIRDTADWEMENFTAIPNPELSLRYNEFISPMIKAIQELSSQVETLKAQISSSSDFNALKTTLTDNE